MRLGERERKNTLEEESSVTLSPMDQLTHLHTHLTGVPWPLRQEPNPGHRLEARLRGRV